MSPRAILLYLIRAIGVFQLCELLTRRELRILCYHGFSIADEAQFRPSMFKPVSDLSQRIDYLRRRNFKFISLDEAVAMHRSNSLAAKCVVVTIDDGWYSTYSHALPYLRRESIPATLYVTTYHSINQMPVFNLLAAYLIWKTRLQVADLSSLCIPALPDADEIPVATPEDKQKLWSIIEQHAKDIESAREKHRLAAALAESLHVDLAKIEESRMFNICTPDEIREMAEHSVDIQLHTHRHSFPVDADGAAREIEDNRRVLAQCVSRELKHFCYPSGVWSEEHWPALERAGVDSATTCEPGLVSYKTNRYAMNRILDTGTLSQIEFEAEVSGTKDMIRRIFRRLQPGRNNSKHQGQ